MSFDFVLGGTIAVLLLGHLAYALLWPEEFQPGTTAMASDLLQIPIFLGVLLACTPLLGGYMARVFAGS
jgi:K+-transporting ATPase KdpF subunit